MRLSTFIFWSIAVSYVYGQCGETKFTEENGTISSLIPYKKGVTCVYTINVVSKDWISLSWEKFKVHGDMPWCMKDRLEIYTGCTTKKLMATFCSDNLASKVPHKIYTQNSCLEIRLISDDKDAYEGNIYIGFTGFTINYKTGVGSAGISYGSCRRFDDKFYIPHVNSLKFKTSHEISIHHSWLNLLNKSKVQIKFWQKGVSNCEIGVL